MPMNRRMTKVPLTLTGRMASSTGPSTWTTYERAKASKIGDGIGFVLGDGIGCVDLDDCFEPDGSLHPVARDVLAEFPHPLRVEISVSGKGLHILHRTPEGPGSMKFIDGQMVERYSRQRFIVLGEPVPARVLAL